MGKPSSFRSHNLNIASHWFDPRADGSHNMRVSVGSPWRWCCLGRFICRRKYSHVYNLYFINKKTYGGSRPRADISQGISLDGTLLLQHEMRFKNLLYFRKKAHLESLIYVLFKLSCCVKGPALLLKITWSKIDKEYIYIYLIYQSLKVRGNLIIRTIAEVIFIWSSEIQPIVQPFEREATSINLQVCHGFLECIFDVRNCNIYATVTWKKHTLLSGLCAPLPSSFKGKIMEKKKHFSTSDGNLCQMKRNN